jgi:hypothetical protein
MVPPGAFVCPVRARGTDSPAIPIAAHAAADVPVIFFAVCGSR